MPGMGGGGIKLLFGFGGAESGILMLINGECTNFVTNYLAVLLAGSLTRRVKEVAAELGQRD